MENTGTTSTTEGAIVTHLDDANFRIAWRNALPRCILNAERWQVLRDAGPEGSQTTIYETWESFGGPLAYFLRFFMRAQLQNSFDTEAHALKDRVERVGSE